MKLVLLAKILNAKYNLQSFGNFQAYNERRKRRAQRVENIKKALLNMYHMYLVEKGKDKALRNLANAEEENSKILIDIVEDMIQNMDVYSPRTLYDKINEALDRIQIMKGPDNLIRTFIDDHYPIRNTRDFKLRDAFKMLYEREISRISSILKNQIDELKDILESQKDEQDEELEGIKGDRVKRVPGDIDPAELLAFKRSGKGDRFGLNNEILNKVLFYPDTRELLRHVMHAVNAGETPRKGNKLYKELKELNEAYHKHTNEHFFEAEE